MGWWSDWKFRRLCAVRAMELDRMLKVGGPDRCAYVLLVAHWTRIIAFEEMGIVMRWIAMARSR